MSSTSRPDSPCVAVCTTLYDEFCRGCRRHYLEVANWNQMVDDKKQEVWDRITKQGYPRRNFTKQEKEDTK